MIDRSEDMALYNKMRSQENYSVLERVTDNILSELEVVESTVDEYSMVIALASISRQLKLFKKEEHISLRIDGFLEHWGFTGFDNWYSD